MPSSNPGLSISDEKRYVGIIFFLFAVQITSWVPRFPEVKKNLGLSNGEFGTYLSLGSVGAVIALISTGHLVQKFGSKRILTLSSFSMCVAIAAIAHLQSPSLFIFINMINGASISAFNIAISAQGFHAQDRAGEMIISRQHGYWTIGALATAIFSGLLVDVVTIALHISVLSAVLFFVISYFVSKLGPELIKPSNHEKDDFKVLDLFKSFRIDVLLSSALAGGIIVEFMSADWSAIYAKERIGVSGSLATIPYIASLVALIIGRLGFHIVARRIPLESMVKIGSVVGGVGFIGFITASNMLVDVSKTASFICAIAGFTIGGLGSSFLTPTFFTAANARSPQHSAIVFGQTAVVNAILVLIIKMIVAWTAQFTGSIAIALIIPGLMLISVAFMSKVVKGI
jgi:MFS family permease